MTGSVDQPPDSLYRSKPVYTCDVFNHSAAAATSLPFQACLLQSFTRKPVAWVSTKTVLSFPQRASRHCRTSHRADIPAEKRINAHIPRRRCQPTPPATMQDMCRSLDYREQSEFENQAQEEFYLAGAKWPGTSLDLHKYGQQHARILPDSHLLYGEQPLHLETPAAQGHVLGQASRMWWDVSTHSNDAQPDLQHLQGDTGVQCLVDSGFVSSFSNSHSGPYAFPLTPPSSTRGEGASPTGGTACNGKNGVHDAQQASYDRSNRLSGGPIIPRTDLMVQPASQYISPELTWSDEEFARFLESDALTADLNSVDYGCAEQPSLNSVWDHQTQVAAQNIGQPLSHIQQNPWSSPVLNQLDYLNNYPFVLPNAFDQASPLANSKLTVTNYNFDTTQQSVQPAPFAVTPYLFDGLSPDVDPVMPGRKSSVKTHQRAAAKDRELIEWKKQGLSYKEIKARGGFDEAESTLRGRYRTLTKPKHLRVRKPEWQQKDVRTNHHT
jgi:hypothetical protein